MSGLLYIVFIFYLKEFYSRIAYRLRSSPYYGALAVVNRMVISHALYCLYNHDCLNISQLRLR